MQSWSRPCRGGWARLLPGRWWRVRLCTDWRDVQVGPDPVEDWRTMAHLIDQTAGPRDVVALVGFYKTEPAFDYFVIAHYVGNWHRSVIFLMGPPDERTKAQLAGRRCGWWVIMREVDTHRLLSGWGIGAVRGIGKRNAVWLLLPPAINSGRK